MAGRMRGKVALITGAGSGIGAETAKRLAAEGARIACVDRIGERAKETARLIGAAGGEAFALVADVGRREDVDRMVEETVRRWGRVDVLVNNAHGFGARGDIQTWIDFHDADEGRTPRSKVRIS